MRIKLYSIISEAVEHGIELGWNRAHKYTDTPTEDVIRTAQYDAVLLELCEILSFDDEHIDIG